MSPQPGDMLETVITVMDNVVIESQAAEVPTDILYFDSIYNYDAFEICLSANDIITSHDYLLDSGIMAVPAVVYTDLEVEYLIEANIALRPENYRGGRLHYAVLYQQAV